MKVLTTEICNDCMHGHHEVLGHETCECICHNNPQCFVCGHNLLTDGDKRADSHISCLNSFNDAKSDEYLDNMITKYGDELFDRN